ncbi:MAG: glycosyltransferase family 2 protein [Actinobacteria bacterium]|nr:glycosyltransferase family 2 protein [Actinomycetota bacterium]MBU4240922.1 glycosyltransferase family 2 protein [Actinomycetota bacterium]MBU4301676.1 glycosyltransferase family 2 protein [Actinomycetota bacterium]MBU4386088.1 glycosyltransferase family 2 protein [Actinomycetota bacterium]MCG2794531.1 glycosyltransferase family 2 protein [Actinomycetes bacterium]
MKLSIIVPVYDERNTIQEILRRVRAVDIGEIAKEIIVVDDGSTDGTPDILKLEEDSTTRVLSHDFNQGKGASVRTALPHVTGDYVIIQDGDLEYDPDDYRLMLAPILKKKAEVVYGSRFTGEHRDMLFWHMQGNKFLSLVTNILYNTTLSDMETCYKLFSRESLEGIRIKSNRFDFEPEITAKILKKKIRIYEVPISYAGREYDEGKKITWKDGVFALWALIKYRFVN